MPADRRIPVDCLTDRHHAADEFPRVESKLDADGPADDNTNIDTFAQPDFDGGSGYVDAVSNRDPNAHSEPDDGAYAATYRDSFTFAHTFEKSYRMVLDRNRRLPFVLSILAGRRNYV